ncbi:MAG: peptidylprolyl isomerase [Bacilli bacterium]|nr:peptidylprolyl isomerase [Bacilli bacterium]
MKNRKKVISLALTALTTIALSSCDNISWNKEGVILSYTYQGESYKLTTDDVLAKYVNEDRTSHAQAFYNALYEIVVRTSFEEGGILSDYMADVTESTENTIASEKEKAEDANQNWYDYLTTKGYNEANMTNEQKDKEFYLDTIYSEMTSKVDEEFLDTFKAWDSSDFTDQDELNLQKEYNLLWGKEGYLENYVPYHVKHILVKAEATQDYAYSHGHISSDNAHKLYETVMRLTEGVAFAEVAKNYSDDTGSASSGGDYIMSASTGFVNEFKLGTYTWDLLLHNQYVNAQGEGLDEQYDAKLENLHIPDNVKDNLVEFGATFIPIGVLQKLEETKDVTTFGGGKTVYGGDEDYLPRNIYFNKYFQNRNVGFITYEEAWTSAELIGTGSLNNPQNSVAGYTKRADNISGNDVFTDIDDTGHYATKGTASNIEGVSADNFEEYTFKIDGNTVTKKILVDDERNPILVVRNKESSGGIHFIVVERSGFDTTDVNFANTITNYTNQGITTEEANKYKTTLEEYFAPEDPKNVNALDPETMRPQYLESFPNVPTTLQNGKTMYVPKKTYVQSNYITANSFVDYTYDTYADKRQNIDDALEENVTTYNKYYWLNKKTDGTLKIKLNPINNVDVQALVDKYVAIQLKDKEIGNTKTLEDSWTAYDNQIKAQTEERMYYLLPEILATNFGDADLYKEGGAGYNTKYDNIDAGKSSAIYLG